MLSMDVAKNKAEITTAGQNDLQTLTERRLRKIAKIKNHQLQIDNFQELLQKKIID